MDIDFIKEFSFPFWVEMGLSLAALFVAFLLGNLKEIIRIRKKGNIDWNIHTQIHEFLTELRVCTKAARAQIVQFHNGEYFLDGVSMQKLSTTHESLANGVSTDNRNGILITLYSPLMEKLDINSPLLNNLDSEKASLFKNTLELANVHSYMVLPLYHNGMKSGFIFLQWCSDDKNDYVVKNESKIKHDMIHYRNIIQTKLSAQLKGSK